MWLPLPCLICLKRYSPEAVCMLFFFANFPLKPPLMGPSLLSFLENYSPFTSWFHFLLMQLSHCVLCKEWSHSQPKIFGVLAWLLNATVDESQNTHSLPNARAAQSDTKGPKESLKICNCGPAGLSDACRTARCITDVIPASFQFGRGSWLVATGAAQPPGTKPWWQVELPAGEGKLMRKGMPASAA